MKLALTSLYRSRNETKSTPSSLRGTEIEKKFADDIGKITSLRSILLLGHYGGMACDILMLVRYVKEWRYSFNGIKVLENISNRINHRVRDDASFSKQSKKDESMNWEGVPYLLHLKSILSSAKLDFFFNDIRYPIIESFIASRNRFSLLIYFGRYCIK